MVIMMTLSEKFSIGFMYFVIATMITAIAVFYFNHSFVESAEDSHSTSHITESIW